LTTAQLDGAVRFAARQTLHADTRGRPDPWTGERYD
jgi:hypothetical protein